MVFSPRDSGLLLAIGWSGRPVQFAGFNPTRARLAFLVSPPDVPWKIQLFALRMALSDGYGTSLLLSSQAVVLHRRLPSRSGNLARMTIHPFPDRLLT
jgi:hypothetical protein